MKLIIDIPDDLYIKLSKSTEDWACCYVEGWQKTIAQTIRNGKPYEETQGDLVSREALKEQFNHLEMVTNNSSVVEQAEYKMLMTCIGLIDNAPTVEPIKQCKFCRYCGNEDYCSNCHSDHSLFELYERPQSKWIDEGVNGWKCYKCGYGVMRYNNTNFCPKCGADMQGGAE